MILERIIFSLYLGGIAVLFGLAALRFWYVLNKLRAQAPNLIEELVDGKPAFAVGTILTPQQSLIHSPYSDTQCVGFVATVHQKVAHFDSKRGFIAPDWTSIGTSVRTSPFLVRDATGVVCVMASRAQLSLSRTLCGELDIKHVFHPVRVGISWFAKRFASAKSLWVSECLLLDGDAVFISGTARLASNLDKQFVPAQFHSTIKYVLKGPDVVVSTTVPASHIPFYEKCMWFCFLTFLVCISLLLALLLMF